MIRYTLFILAILGTAATAIAAAQPSAFVGCIQPGQPDRYRKEQPLPGRSARSSSRNAPWRIVPTSNS